MTGGPTPTPDGVEYQAAPPTKPAPEPCSRLEIEPTPGGGFAVTCFYRPTQNKRGEPGNVHQPKSAAFSAFPELVAFLGDTFGVAPTATPAPPPAPAPTAMADDVDEY